MDCYAEYTKAAEDLVGAKEFFAESSGSGGDAEMKEMAREEVKEKARACRPCVKISRSALRRYIVGDFTQRGVFLSHVCMCATTRRCCTP